MTGPRQTAVEFMWRDFTSALILLFSWCKTSLFLVKIYYSSSVHSERHFTALLTHFKWKLTGMYLQSSEPGLCFLPLKLKEIRLCIFSCLKLTFGKPSEVNHSIFEGCTGMTSLHVTDVFDFSRMEVEDHLYLSAHLHLCFCSQLSQLSTNVNIPVIGHHTGLDS